MKTQPLDPYLRLHHKANDKTGFTNWRRGIINSINLQAGTCSVSLVGNTSSVLKDIYFSSAVNTTLAKVGDKCLVWMFSEINPADSVVLVLYGRNMQTLLS